HRHGDLRRHGERRSAHDRAVGDRPALPGAARGLERLLPAELPGAPHRLRAPRHPDALRPGAARLPREAREAPVTLRILALFAIAEITPQWHRDSGTWRYERLVDVLRPIYGGVTTWDRGPRRVRLGGWLTYDFEYEGSRPVAPFPPHLSFWEIHPVTRIEVWD